MGQVEMRRKLAARIGHVSARKWVACSGWGMVAAAAVLLMVAWTWSRVAWLPSLTCNLVTTGIAILVINRVVADAAAREEGQRREYRRHRRKLRQDKRIARRREMMRPEAGYPAAATLELGSDLIDVALQSDLSAVLAYLGDKQKAYLEHARALGHFSLVYGRFMTFKEIGAIESMRRIVKNLAFEAGMKHEDDVQKVQISRMLEALSACAIVVGMCFNDQKLLTLQSAFNEKVGALGRKWDVLGIVRRGRDAPTS